MLCVLSISPACRYMCLPTLYVLTAVHVLDVGVFTYLAQLQPLFLWRYGHSHWPG
jgi:hypothetical protein